MSSLPTRKHSLVGLWHRSSENAGAGARHSALACAEREFGAAQIEAAKKVVDFWAGKATRALATKPK